MPIYSFVFSIHYLQTFWVPVSFCLFKLTGILHTLDIHALPVLAVRKKYHSFLNFTCDVLCTQKF